MLLLLYSENNLGRLSYNIVLALPHSHFEFTYNHLKQHFQDKIDEMCAQCEGLRTTYHVTKETPTDAKYKGNFRKYPVRFLSIVCRFSIVIVVRQFLS